MFWLGLLLMVCYVPGYTGAFIPTQWAVLSAFLPLALWRSATFGPAHVLGLLALGWAALSMLWAPEKPDAIFRIWQMLILGEAFWLGSTIDDLRPLWKGIAMGVAISSFVTLFQQLGYRPVITANGSPGAGLLFNTATLGAIAALMLIALHSSGSIFWTPLVIPALVLTHSRGAWLIVILTAIASRSIALALSLLCIGCIVFSTWPGPSDAERLIIWGSALHKLVPLGHGAGSFTDFVYFNPAHDWYGYYRPEAAHNDYLQLVFEFGIGAVPAFAIYGICLAQRWAKEIWPIFFAFAILSLFYFPLYHPVLAFIGCVSAGRLATAWHELRIAGYHWRSAILQRDMVS